MCDFGLHHVNRGQPKSATSLPLAIFGTGTRGFAASEDANTAVCLLPGTELSFAGEVRCVPRGPFSGDEALSQSQDRYLSASQQGQGSGPPRCLGISGRPNRATNFAVRRPAGHCSSATGGSEDSH